MVQIENLYICVEKKNQNILVLHVLTYETP